MKNIDKIRNFKAALKYIVDNNKVGTGLSTSGLCGEIDRVLHDGLVANLSYYHAHESSYKIMQNLLTSDEYYNGLGKNYVYTQNRRNFAIALLAIPNKDISEIVFGK